MAIVQGVYTLNVNCQAGEHTNNRKDRGDLTIDSYAERSVHWASLISQAPLTLFNEKTQDCGYVFGLFEPFGVSSSLD